MVKVQISPETRFGNFGFTDLKLTQTLKSNRFQHHGNERKEMSYNLGGFSQYLSDQGCTINYQIFTSPTPPAGGARPTVATPSFELVCTRTPFQPQHPLPKTQLGSTLVLTTSLFCMFSLGQLVTYAPLLQELLFFFGGS